MMEMHSSGIVRKGRVVVLAAAVAACSWSNVFAQTAPAAQATAAPATGAPDATAQQDEATPSKKYTLSSGIDFPTAYMFRGIFQEDQGMIGMPFVDVGVTLYEGDGALSSASANFGMWNSLHSGPSGADNPLRSAWYEADYYASLTLGFGKVKPGALYTAYTSPNDAFLTVHEIAFSVAYDDSASKVPLSPKALVAFELKGQADGGENKGTYFEFGVRPTVKLVDAKYPLSLAIPLKIGTSLKDYYEGVNGSDKFGYFDAGFMLNVPFSSNAGTWDLHGGVDFLMLGDNLKFINGDDSVKPVGTFGISLTY